MKFKYKYSRTPRAAEENPAWHRRGGWARD
jgi:hypothetical protein